MSRIDSFRDPSLAFWPSNGLVVLFDLEYTSWPGSLKGNWSLPKEHREIVQLGAARVRVKGGVFTVLEAFDQMVRPVINPKLSDHFIHLTGITNERLEQEAREFPTVWAQFCRFCEGADQLWCMGKDGEVLRENFVLQKMADRFPTNCFDIRPALAKILNRKEDEIVSSRLPELVHIEPPERAHQALFDVLSVLKALNHLSSEGKLL